MSGYAHSKAADTSSQSPAAPDGTQSQSQADVVAFLSKRESYGLSAGAVEQHSTHGAVVFLAGTFAYKLKRAIRFPYMDYSSVQLRHQMCERELFLNRKISPSLYVDVRPIVRDARGLHFGRHDGQNVVDWVVVMRRFDESALLEERRKAGNLNRGLMLALAEIIAEFHIKAERTPTFGGARKVQSVIEENLQILGDQVNVVFEAARIARLAKRSKETLCRLGPMLDNRRDNGFVRRCHGDLHLNNICVIDGKPVLFDALEFSDEFSCIDVLYDLAFLLMDLDVHSLRGHANTIFNRYLERTGDYDGLAAMRLFLSCRAAVRAHVTLAAGGSDDEARRFFEAALEYLADRQPQLIAIGGLSGSGKSTLARNLAPALGNAPGAVVLRSDVLRKQMMGVAETAVLDERAYSGDATKAVYQRMCALASVALAAGQSVIADAVFGTPAEHCMIADVARVQGIPFDGIWLEAAEPVLAARIEGRTGDASDATRAVLRSQIETSAIPPNWHRIDSTFSAPETLLEAVQSVL